MVQEKGTQGRQRNVRVGNFERARLNSSHDYALLQQGFNLSIVEIVADTEWGGIR